MLSSLASVTLFSAFLLSGSVSALGVGYNATTTALLPTPEAPVTATTEVSLDLPSSTTAITSTAPAVSAVQPFYSTDSSQSAVTSDVSTTAPVVATTEATSDIPSTTIATTFTPAASSAEQPAVTTDSAVTSAVTTTPGTVLTPEAPVTATAEPSLDVPSTTIAPTTTTTPVAISETQPAVTSDAETTSSSTESTTAPEYASPIIKTSATALITSDAATTTSTPAAITSDVSVTSPIFTYAPSTTSEAESVSTPLFTYAPSTTAEAESVSTPLFTYAPSDSSTASSPLFTYVPSSASTASSPLFTYAPASTSTTTPSGLLASYINSVVQSSAAKASVSSASSDSTAAAATTSSPVQSAASVTAPMFVYGPSSTTKQSAAITVSIGSSAISFAPVPQSEAESGTSSSIAAFVIGSQTASVGQTLTVDNTPVVVQTSAGLTQVYAGSATYTYTPPAVTTAPAPESTITGTPTVMTIGLATVSQDSAGAYVLGSYTLTPGSSITQGAGSSYAVVGLETADGTTHLVYQDASNTASSAVSPVTSAPTVLTVGLATVSQNSAGAYMMGSYTLSPGSSITQGSGSSFTVVGLDTSDGTTQLVYQDASTTASSAMPLITSATSTSSASIADSSLLIIGGHTYSIGPASLNAKETGTATSAASGFVTSGVSGAAAGPSSTSSPSLQQNAAPVQRISCLVVGFVASVLGFIALL